MKAIVHNEYGNEAVLTIAETAKPALVRCGHACIDVTMDWRRKDKNPAAHGFYVLRSG